MGTCRVVPEAPQVRPVVSELADDEVIGPLLPEFTRELVVLAFQIDAAARRQDQRTVREMCHRLCGTSAIFGFPAMSAAAGAVEQLLVSRRADEASLAAAVADLVDAARAIDAGRGPDALVLSAAGCAGG